MILQRRKEKKEGNNNMIEQFLFDVYQIGKAKCHKDHRR